MGLAGSGRVQVGQGGSRRVPEGTVKRGPDRHGGSALVWEGPGGYQRAWEGPQRSRRVQ